MADFDKPSNQEDEYFAREEIEKKRKLALQQSSQTAVLQREELKKLHFMKCPKCGMDLSTLQRGDVEIDTCFNCHGIWLDAGELEALVERGEQEGRGIVRSIVNVFRPYKKGHL